MSMGDKWATTTTGSASKLNKMTIISGTGAYLAGVTKTEHTILVCTSTGSGFTLDHVYLCSNDGTTVIDLSDVNEHDHSSEGTGGTFMSILRNNPNVIDSGSSMIMNPVKSKWFTNDTTGTSTLTDTTDGGTGEQYIAFDTGATNASTATLRQRTLEWDNTKDSWFKCLHKFDTASSLAVKVGLGVEFLSVADGNDRKYGYELCTTVNNNYFSLSADGTTRSSSDTGVAMDTARTSFYMKCFPDEPKTDLFINEGTVFTKTSNIPTTYNDNTGANSVPVVTFKNNTAASRILRFYGIRVVYQTSDKWDQQ